jgi:hypothetical protein
MGPNALLLLGSNDDEQPGHTHKAHFRSPHKLGSNDEQLEHIHKVHCYSLHMLGFYDKEGRPMLAHYFYEDDDDKEDHPKQESYYDAFSCCDVGYDDK